MKVLMDKQMNQLEYVETAEDMIKVWRIARSVYFVRF